MGKNPDWTMGNEKGIEKIKIDALKRKIRRNQCLFFRFSELIFCKRAVVERWCSN